MLRYGRDSIITNNQSYTIFFFHLRSCTRTVHGKSSLIFHFSLPLPVWIRTILNNLFHCLPHLLPLSVFSTHPETYKIKVSVILSQKDEFSTYQLCILFDEKVGVFFKEKMMERTIFFYLFHFNFFFFLSSTLKPAEVKNTMLGCFE